MEKSNMNKNKNDSTNISCRIDTETYNSLATDAKSKGISMNSLINSIIKRHLQWDLFAEEIGLISLTKHTMKKIFQTMDVETIKKIAQDVGGTVPQELFYLSYDKRDFTNLMKMLQISNSRFGKVKYYVNDTTHYLYILHGVCKNFSIFLAETHQTLAYNLSLKFNIEHSDNNMICIGLKKPDNSLNHENSEIIFEN